ncbi:MAG: extracellular solute-binding protein [Lachnospiraceae bacterium]|nr:extracellular solute-binding protein [Lachnospiraceae bacterium]
MKKRVLAVLMTGAMVTGMLAGCGDSGTSTNDSSTKTDNSTTTNAGTEASSGEEDLSPITFEYYNADGKNGNWSETAVGAAITDATGVTLEITYPVSSTGDASEDVALMIANDEYPDMIYSKASVTNLYEAGALIDMRDLIEQYGPNIKKMYGDEFEKLKWSAEDDGIYQLSYAGVRGTIFGTGGTCQIQYAVLKENNYEYPKTLEEYEAMIKSYLEAHPTTEDGLETIGISMSASDWHWMITLGNPAGFIADAAPDNGQWLIDENYNCTYKHTSDAEKEYFRWLSRMYDEGILDQNFATQTDDDYIAKLSSGRVVAITDANWHYMQAEAALKAEGKLDKTYCGLPVVMDPSKKAPTLMYQGLQVGYGLAITKSCEDPVRAIKFLDYLCSEEGAILYKWGIEGTHYFINDEGKRYRTEEEITKSKTDPDYGKTTGIGNYVGFPIYGDGVLDSNGDYMTPISKESVIAEYNEIELEACEAWGAELLIDIFPQPDEFETPVYSPLWAYAIPQELSNNVTILDEIAFPSLVKCVTEPESSFDANWDAMIAELKANGLDETNAMMTEFLATKVQ